MTQSLVSRIKATLDYAARIAIIESATADEIRESRDDIKLLMKELRGTLNTLVDRLVDVGPERDNGEHEVPYEEYKPEIAWNAEYFTLDPNKVSNDTTPAKYLRLLAEQYNIPYDKLTHKKSRTRKHDPASERIKCALREATYTLKTKYEKSFPEIGTMLGSRHHTTIMEYYISMCDDLGIDSSCKTNGD